jgi:hypothetical protein
MPDDQPLTFDEAATKLRDAPLSSFVEPWAVPVINWLAKVLNRG